MASPSVLGRMNKEDDETNNGVVAAWLEKQLKFLKEIVAAERFHNGDSRAMLDDYFDSREADLLDESVSRTERDLCVGIFSEMILKQQHNSSLVLEAIFPWFRNTSKNHEDVCLTLAYLLVDEVLIGKCLAMDIMRPPLLENYASLKKALASRGDCDCSIMMLEQEHFELDDAGAEGGRRGEDVTNGLTVSFIKMTDVLRFDTDPPKHGSIPEREPSAASPDSRDLPPYKKPVKVFISHRWKSAGEPNFDGDWNRLANFMLTLVQNAMLACTILLRNDFPLEEFLEAFSNEMLERQESVVDMPVPTTTATLMLEERDFYDDEEASLSDGKAYYSTVAKIKEFLSTQVLLVAASQFLPVWEAYEAAATDHDKTWIDCAIRTLDRIWLWYDYTCIPQFPRETPALEERFQKTMLVLSELQLSMQTLSMNTDDTYFERAWCTAEWLNAGRDTGSLWDRDFAGNHFEDDEDKVGHGEILRSHQLGSALYLLLDPRTPTQDVLRRMGLTFSNDLSHVDHSETMCGILWSAVRRSRTLWFDFSILWRNELENEPVRIAFGTKQDTLTWLEVIKVSLQQQQTSDSAGSSIQVADLLPEWFALRKKYSGKTYEEVKEDDVSKVAIIRIPVKGTAGVNLENLLLPAIEAAIENVSSFAITTRNNNDDSIILLMVLLENETHDD